MGNLKKHILILVAILIAAIVFPIASSALSQTQTIHIVGTAQYPNRPYPANPSFSDIAVNGGFESGTTPWQVITSGSTYSGTISQSSDAHSGVASGSFKITSNPATGGYVALAESVVAKVGESYVLSFYYKSTLGSFSAYVFCKDMQTSVGHDLAYWSTGNLPASDLWTWRRWRLVQFRLAPWRHRFILTRQTA